MRPHRLAWSRTPDSHSGNTGSNPVGATRNATRHKYVGYDELMPFLFSAAIPAIFPLFPYVSHIVGSNLGSNNKGAI